MSENKEKKKEKKAEEKETPEQEIERLKSEVEHWKNEYYRAYADTKNLRNNLEKEHREAIKYRSEGFLEELLPVLDSFHSVLSNEPEDPNLKNYLIGFQYIYRNLVSVLENEGVVEIAPQVGDKFDPNVMSAVDTVEGEDNVIGDNAKVVGATVMYSGTGYDKGYPIPTHKKGAIGAINSVFGGGNEAKVIGNPTVNIGTEAGEEVYVAVEVETGESAAGYYTRSEYSAATGTAVEGTTYYEKDAETGEYTEKTVTVGNSVAGLYIHEESYTTATGNAVAGTTYYLKTVKAVDIRGDVFGGGNNAEVQGDTNVVIGKRSTTTP